MIRKIFQLLPVVGALLLLLSGCSTTVSGPGAYGGSTSGGTGSGTSGGSTVDSTTSPSAPSGATPNWGVQTKTSGCHVNGPLQDQACTPGDIIKTATKAEICVPGYAGKTRNVPQSEKNLAYSSYGILSHKTGAYEVDHLVSLQLGGSNDISNLWPEIATPKPGFHEKDKVENYLHAQLCKGAMTLNQVQVAIATNWIAVYNSMPSSTKSGGTGGVDGSA